MPKSNFRISLMAVLLSISTSSFATVSEVDFNSVLKKVETTYQSDFAALGLKLVVDGEYQDVTQNAYTTRLGKTQIVKVLGGSARIEAITSDEIAFIACHETGHTLAGEPVRIFGSYPISVEGQADYFSSAKCFKRVFRNEDNTSIVEKFNVPASVKLNCHEQFSDNPNEAALCIRASLAGINVANWLASFAKNPLPSVDVKDSTVVTLTNKDFPNYQCRLDTFLAGALCRSTSDDGYCHNDEVGSRPLCWFKP